MTANESLLAGGPVESLRRFLAPPVRVQTYKNLAYLALAFPLGLAYFVGATIGIAFGVSLMITWIGLPILIVTVAAATVVAGFEARLAEHLLGIEVELPEALRGFDPGEEVSKPGNGFLTSVKRLLLAPTTWTSLLLVLVKFWFGVAALVALASLGSLTVSMLSAPFFYGTEHVVYQFGPYVVDSYTEAMATFGGGALLGFVSLHAFNALARLGGYLTAALLDVGADDP